MKNFDEIRPYQDHEVPDVIERLLQSDALIQALIHVQFPRAPRYLDNALARFVRYRIHSNLKDTRTVADFQRRMHGFLEATISKSITEFTFGGLENLQAGTPYVFVSNHRDITLDSALLNYLLLQNGHDTAEIAIGDNLLSNPLVSDLLRLNKSFVVRRSVSGIKAKFAALSELSHYINDAHEDGRSVWIAQREGRAKDGFDITDPAIIKMLHIWPKKSGMDFNTTINRLNLVPVSISYEYDPCDGLKATEMQARLQPGYVKNASEDVESIMRGIALPKGRVHIEIGTPLQGEFSGADAVAHAMDEQIIRNYKVFPPSLLAVEHLANLGKAMHSLKEEYWNKINEITAQARESLSSIDSQELARQATEFSARLGHYPVQIQQTILEMYANPLLNKHKYSVV